MPFGSFAAVGIGWLAVLLVAAWARLSPLTIMRGGVIATPFLFTAFPLIFTVPGEHIGEIDLRLFTLSVSEEGVIRFLTIAAKSWVSVQAAALMTFTTPFPDLIEALRRLRMPAIMVGVMSFMYRYLAVLTDEASRMLRARTARSAEIDGYKAGGNVVWRARVVGGMVGSLFIRAYERSERVYAAMLSRGYDGEIRVLRQERLGADGWTVLALAAMLLVAFQVTARIWLPIQ